MASETAIGCTPAPPRADRGGDLTLREPTTVYGELSCAMGVERGAAGAPKVLLVCEFSHSELPGETCNLFVMKFARELATAPVRPSTWNCARVINPTGDLGDLADVEEAS